MIVIRFIADRSLLSRAIRFRTEGSPSHVEYLFVRDADSTPTTTFGARLAGGVCHRPYDYCTPTWEEWYAFEGIEASYEAALAFEGRKYDWKDIAALAVDWHPAYYDPQRAICSCLVGYSNRLAWAAGKAPALLNENMPTWQFTPQIVYGAVTEMIRKVR